MLVKNAQNLMRAVIKTVQAAEAACMRVCFSLLPRYEPNQLILLDNDILCSYTHIVTVYRMTILTFIGQFSLSFHIHCTLSLYSTYCIGDGRFVFH